MKNTNFLFLIVITFFVYQSAFAQEEKPMLNVTLANDYRATAVTADASKVVIQAGSEVAILRFRKSPITYKPELMIRANGVPYYANQNLMDAVDFDVKKYSLNDIWTYEYLKSDALQFAIKSEEEKETRVELEREYESFQSQIDIYQDEFLDDYLHKLAFEMFPGGFESTFPATLRLRIYSGLEPASFATSNGEIFLSTGLLSALRSEEELKAVICLEIAHLYLDHPFQNYKSILRSQRRAEFWAGVATVGAAALEVAAFSSANRSGTLSPFQYAYFGDFTAMTAFLSFGLAETISTRLGLDYNEDQKKKALLLAGMVFDKLRLDRDAFTAVYGRIDDYYNLQSPHRLIHKRYNRYDHAYTYADLKTLRKSNKYQTPSDRFMTLMQSLNLSTAFGEYNDRNYAYVEHLVETEISLGNAIINYYMLNAMVQRRKPDNKAGISDALQKLNNKIDEAKYLPLDLYREIAMLHLRLENNSEALNALQKYRDMIIDNPQIERDANALRWVDQMIQILEADMEQG